MFEGIYFQFPKLAFLFFFFLACEALCPLRSNPIYFPRTLFFAASGVKRPLWHWIAKWAMVAFMVIALMSPVRNIPLASLNASGYDILVVADPEVMDASTRIAISDFISRREADRMAFWMPGEQNVIIPMSTEGDVLRSMTSQLQPGVSSLRVTRDIERFFAVSGERMKWVLILSNRPEAFVRSLPVGVKVSVIKPAEEPSWALQESRSIPAYPVMIPKRYFEFFYVYPLFASFLAMLAYLYGRNQKGLR